MPGARAAPSTDAGGSPRRRLLRPVNLLLPFTPVRARWVQAMVAVQAVAAVALWALGGSRRRPSPMEVGVAWLDLVQHQGLLFELWASVKVSVLALVLSTLAAVATAALATAPLFMPGARLAAALRFLGFAGLTYVFMLMSSDATALRVWILAFGLGVFMVTALLADLAATPRDT